MANKKQVHFIGIGGSGLSAIAKVLLERGYKVSGSDRQASPIAQRLQQAGVQIFYGHDPRHVNGADWVVRSSAIPDDNVEVQAALAAGVPVYKRAEFLGQLMLGQQAIAVAGTHGKTTTTAMIAWILTALRRDPSYVIGGFSVNLGSNAHAGRGQYFVIEADEYDRMFLGLQPKIAVVTNIEHDHPDCYPTPQDFYQAFSAFSDRLESGGVLVACADDPGAARLISEAKSAGKRSLSYGISQAGFDYQATKLALNNTGGFSFEVLRGGSQVVLASLRVPGEHNVRNALAALAVADLVGLQLQEACEALNEFRGTGRRFEMRGEIAGVTLIDDYAHHPTEIRATLQAARTRFPGREIWAIWQPHTYSRTRALFSDFITAFEWADHVLVTEVYAARELPPNDGFSAQQVVEAMQAGANSRQTIDFTPGLEETRNFLLEHLKPGDVVIILSAGDADQINLQLEQALQSQSTALADSGEK